MGSRRRWWRVGLGPVLVAGLSLTMVAASGAPLPQIPVKAAPPPISEGAPAAHGVWLAWAQNTRAAPYRSSFYVQRAGHPRIRVSAPGTLAGGGGIDGHVVVFSQQARLNVDLYRFDLRTHRRSPFPARVNTKAAEYAPSVSGRWVLFTRFSPGRNLWKILLYDRRSGRLRTLARHPGKDGIIRLTAGQVNGQWAVWDLQNGPRGTVFRYNIASRTTRRIPRPAGTTQFGAAVSAAGTVYYTQGRALRVCRGGPTAIVRRPVGHRAQVVSRNPAGRTSTNLFVEDRADGARAVYFESVDCATYGGEGPPSTDVYKVLDPARG